MLAEHPSQVIILFSAHLDNAVQQTARAVGIRACVSKAQVSRLPNIIRDLLPQG